MEFYLDDILIESYALPAEASGRIGLINSIRYSRNSESMEIMKAYKALVVLASAHLGVPGAGIQNTEGNSQYSAGTG